MLAILAPIFVFGLVIFVHELGHFIAAKLLGVYAPRFSIGFGPTLWKRRRGETEYVLAALPLGGYVRMASTHDEEAAVLEGGSEEKSALKSDDPGFDPDAMLPFGPRPIPPHRWFESKPLWGRLVILLAGVFMNIVLTFIVATGLAMHFGRPIFPTTVVGQVDTLAWAPGLQQVLQPGDTIRSIDGRPVRTWNEVLEAFDASRGDSLVLATSRGRVALPTRGDERRTREVAGAVDLYQPAIIGRTLAGRPARAAGLATGDTVVAIAGTPVRSWQDVVEAVGARPAVPTVITVHRAGGRRDITVTPEPIDDTDPETGTTRKVGRIGAASVDISRKEPISFAEGVRAGWGGTWRMGGAIVNVVHGLFSGNVSVRQLGGPIEITRASVEAGQDGLVRVLELIAFLSINVAILNLLPIPILDGGQVLLNVAESVKGSPFSARTREYILRVGLAAIGLLFVLVMYNDITRLVGRLFG